jgi:hypothetical protein
MMNNQTSSKFGNSPIHHIMMIYLHYLLLRGSSVGITHHDVVYGPIVVIAVMRKKTSSMPLAGCDAAVNVLRNPELARFQPNMAVALDNPLKHHQDSSEYVFSDHFSNMVNIRWKHVKCLICKGKSFDKNRLQAHYQQYYPIMMNATLLCGEISAAAGWDPPEPSWFNFSRYT